MDASESEGLGLSLLLYVAAIAGTLALVAAPVYFASRPQVYDNPPLARADPLLNGPIIGKRVSTRVPVARLKREIIVDASVVAALNAKSEKPATEHHATHRAAQRPSGTSMAELRPEPQQPTFFLFRLFGG
jgi:hypothetical protein